MAAGSARRRSTGRDPIIEFSYTASGGKLTRLHQLDLIFAIFGAFDRDKRLILLS